MTKLNRYLLIALVLQLGIVLVSRMASQSVGQVKTRKLLDGLDVAKVTRVQIENGEKKAVTLERHGSDWVLASGGGYAAEKDKMTGLIGKLTAVTAKRPVATRKPHHRALEVAEDKFQRRISIEQEGGKSFRFLLGSSPGIKNVHFRLASEDDVYLVNDLSAWDAGAAAGDWVKTEYFKVERDSIVQLRLKNAQGEIQLDKGADGKWVLASLPTGSTLKQSEVDGLLSSASNVSLQEPVGKSIEAKYGLADDAAKALLTVVSEKQAKAEAKDKPAAAGSTPAPTSAPAAPERTTHRLVVGVKEGDGYYAKSDSSPFVVRLATWAAETFINKKPADFVEQEKDKAKVESKDGVKPPSQG